LDKGTSLELLLGIEIKPNLSTGGVGGHRDRRKLDLQLSMQSVSITTKSKVVSSIPEQGEVYSIKLYVIKFVNDLRQIGGFLSLLRFLLLIKLTATILLKYC